jgi:hypothetical protein
MPGTRDRHHKKNHSSESSSSSSSSSDSESYQSESLSFGDKRRHRKYNHCKEKKCDSESEIACYSNEYKHCNKKKDCSSSSSSESECEYKMCDIYTYFKNRLLEDKELMVAGSSSYLNCINDLSQTISNNHALDYSTVVKQYNIETEVVNTVFFVREDGYFILFAIAQVDNSCQFTIFINGVVVPSTCIGTNSGAGQVVSRHLLKLNKDDNVTIRNYISSASSLKSNLYSGGSNPGNDLTLLLMKIAPTHQPHHMYEHECHEYMKCLSHQKKKLFHCLTDKLKDDTELMVRGFNVTGTFYSSASQQVVTEGGVAYNAFSNVNGMVWNPSSTDPTQIQVFEDGVYKVFFLINTNTPGQFSIAVNGIPVETSTQGSSKGAGQISIRSLLDLNKNDIIQVLNHTSQNGSIAVSTNCGGLENNINVVLTIFKIAPLVKPSIKPVDCKLAKRFECYYEKFKKYLLCKNCLQIDGSGAFVSLVSSVIQPVSVNDSFIWDTNVHLKEFKHTQGKTEIWVERDGLYDLFVDIATDEPLQYALFVNGVVDPSVIFGRDSGANRCLMRQFVKLNKGDRLEIRNYTSGAGTIHTVANAGGEYIGNNSLFMAFMLHPTCSEPDCCVPCKPECCVPSKSQVSKTKSTRK